jgi:hypothetical protein
MSTNGRDPAWLDWYQAQHERGFRLTATAFEKYVTEVLDYFHHDFINPDPAGSLGDGGCDGVAEAGELLYACYGTKGQDEYKLRDKVTGDLSRALDKWPAMQRWRFVTNATFGPLATKAITTAMADHGPSMKRPLNIHRWGDAQFWRHVVSQLERDALDRIFPDAPGVANVELEDMLPLLDRLGEAAPSPSDEVRPVPLGKMTYNALSLASRNELDAGRRSATRIQTWFAQGSQPDLKDRQAESFRRIYREKSAVTDVAGEILERLYIAVGGSDFRQDSVRANAVYAVTAYFFDECDVFEEPPDGWHEGMPARAFRETT